MRAAKGGPNMVSKGPAMTNALRATGTVHAKTYTPKVGSMAGYSGEKSAFLQTRRTGYDNPMMQTAKIKPARTANLNLRQSRDSFMFRRTSSPLTSIKGKR